MKTADWIESEFERLAQSPEGIPKLREFVLQLAVQGKLVAQDPNDEPASELLKRIAAEKEQLVKDGKIKKSKPLPPIEEDEIPFEIPQSWEWVQTGNISTLETGKRMKGGAQQDGVISLGGEHLKPDGTVDYSVPRYVTEAFFLEMKTGRVELNDTLMVKDGATTGKTSFVERLPDSGKAAINEHVFIVRACEPINKQLTFFFIKSLAMEFVATQSQGIIGGVKRDAVLNLLFPLPPLAEQHRIVAKVDELMALCYELEAKQTAKTQTKEALNGAALHHVRSATDPAELDSATRFYVGQMDTLADVPQAIPPIRETILQLAAQGKLVPQDPNDEPASELLKRIAAEKEQLVKDGKIKKPKQLPPIGNDEIAHKIPVNWKWCRLGEICRKITDGFHNTPSKVTKGFPYIAATHVKSSGIDFSNAYFVSEIDHRELYAKTEPQKGEILVVNIGAGSGCASIIDVDYEFSFKNTAILKFNQEQLFNRFLLSYLRLVQQRNYERLTRGGNQPFLSLSVINNFVLPLPPLAEQHRIVAKVDELMALCDQLEARLTTAQDLNQQLTQAILTQTA